VKLIRLLILLSIWSMTAAACGQQTVTPEPPIEPALEDEDALREPATDLDILPRVTITPSAEGESAPVDDAYPVATEVPFVEDAGYPAPVDDAPTSIDTGYPAPEGSVWIIFPVGVQCGAAEENRYPDLASAIAGLTAAGITVNNSEMVDLLVCAACGCPTSAHYRVEIDGDQLNSALSLEWQLEPEE
jgi:hypothetical protein